MRLLKLSSERWLKLVFVATMLVFVGVTVYVYAIGFSAQLHPDDAVPVLLADKALHAKSMVAGDWYYANGDIWVFGPQLVAVLPVALFGVGHVSLVLTLIIGLLLQVWTFTAIYRRLGGGEAWIAVLAAMATLIAWSSAHVDYIYVQLAYGFVTALYMASFTLFASLAERPRIIKLALTGLLTIATAMQNPTRALVFGLAPLLVACAWPWRGFPWRHRLVLAGTAIAGWIIAFAAYRSLAASVELSVPRGHMSFMVAGMARIKANLALLGHGFVELCGGSSSAIRAIPCIVLLLGALILVLREAFRSRVFTVLRFVCVIVLVQFGGVLVPLVVGNLLTDIESVRYVLPSLLAILGLAVVIAVPAASEIGSGWKRRMVVGFLVALPVAALTAVPHAEPPGPKPYVRPDALELEAVSDALVRRGLTFGFSINIAANLIRLDSHGSVLACPVHFRNVIIPHRWLTDSTCFTATTVPDRFFVVTDQVEFEQRSVRQTLGTAVEHFTVGTTYDVFVFEKSKVSLAWLDLPIRDGELATFPLHLPATHLQIVAVEATTEAGDVVATGKEGTVVYGPYIELPKGAYEVRWIGRGFDAPGRIAFSVVLDGRQAVVRREVESRQSPRAHSELVKLAFSVRRAGSVIEFPVVSTGGGRVSLHELVIERK